MLYFNADNGYLEGIVRGYKDAIISNSQYMNLTQCESLEGTCAVAVCRPIQRSPGTTFTDFKLQLASTDYGPFLANEQSPIATSAILARCTDKLVEEFRYLRANAVQPLAAFLDYITYAGRFACSRCRFPLIQSVDTAT